MLVSVEIDGAVSNVESDADESDEDDIGQNEEEESVDELDFSKLDLHDTIHGLKVLYKEKHGEDPSDEIVEQWHINLTNAKGSNGQF